MLVRRCTYIHTYIHTYACQKIYIHTYIHMLVRRYTYIHTYACQKIFDVILVSRLHDNKTKRTLNNKTRHQTTDEIAQHKHPYMPIKTEYIYIYTYIYIYIYIYICMPIQNSIYVYMPIQNSIYI